MPETDEAADIQEVQAWAAGQPGAQVRLAVGRARRGGHPDGMQRLLAGGHAAGRAGAGGRDRWAVEEGFEQAKGEVGLDHGERTRGGTAA
jgi:hypothetical protein